MSRSIQRIASILLSSFTGIKSAGTILGSHVWQLDKLENFAITFWEKPTLQFVATTAIFV